MSDAIKLRIVQKPESRGRPRTLAHDVQIFINDVEQKHIRDLQLRVAARDVVTATITFFPSEIEVDAELLALLNIPSHSPSEEVTDAEG